MRIRKPTYKELEERLAEAEAAIAALRSEEVDAVVGQQHVLLLRLKEVEQALRQSEEFSSGLLTNAPNPILVINPDTSIGYVNPAMEKLTGFSRAELVGTKAPYPWWADETLDKIHRDFEEAVLKGKGARKLEELFQTKAGERFQVEITSKFVKSNGESKYYLENWVDITERKRIEARLLWEASVNEAIVDLSSALILPKSIEDIAYDVLEHAKRLTSSEFGYVSHIDPQAGYHIASTLTRDIWDICQVENKDIIFEKFTGLWGWVLDNRKPLMTNDPSNDPRSCGTPEGHVPIRRFLSVPALVDGTLVGQIALANSDHDYAERDLAVVERLAALYAIALQRKRGEEELQKARDELEQRVQERTAELAEANRQLELEIEEHKRAEETLRKSEKRFRDLVENSLTCISIIQDDHIVYQNPEHQKLLGLLTDSPIPLLDLETVHPNDVEKVRESYQRILSGEALTADIDFRFYPPGKKNVRADLKWVYCRTSAIEYREKSAILVTLMDVTRAKELERLLNIEDKMRSLGHVAAGIAHEIRNPLSGINIYLNALERIYEKPNSSKKTKEVLGKLQSASNKIESVINRVVDFSKPSEPRFTMTDINQPIKEAIALASVTLRKGGIAIEKALAKDLPQCRADPHLIEQVILNLITNAAEAMEGMQKAKKIRITSSVKKRRLLVTVSDSGPGVPLNLGEEIFDPFYTTKNGSTGLGLSLSHRIITDHGGSLRAGASVLGGAELIIEIPVEEGTN
jgi:PAS domain S-box-containing protein